MDWIININMIHISPWEATLESLMKVAGQKLKIWGTLFYTDLIVWRNL
jgi:hypothetical protein